MCLKVLVVRSGEPAAQNTRTWIRMILFYSICLSITRNPVKFPFILPASTIFESGPNPESWSTQWPWPLDHDRLGFIRRKSSKVHQCFSADRMVLQPILWMLVLSTTVKKRTFESEHPSLLQSSRMKTGYARNVEFHINKCPKQDGF